jgi:DNA-binding transcriptional ArsR family regulator
MMDKLAKLANIFKALGDLTRLRLVNILINADEALCVNELAKKLQITQSAVSQHLRLLKLADIVVGKKHGYFVHYEVNYKIVNKYDELFLNLFKEN